MTPIINGFIVTSASNTNKLATNKPTTNKPHNVITPVTINNNESVSESEVKNSDYSEF